VPIAGDKPWSIVLASREVWPFVEGGGIGRCVWAGARMLAEHAEVTVLTSEGWRSACESMAAADDPRLPAGVRFEFAAEPEGDLSPFVSWHHAWSDRLRRRIVELFPDGGPDLVEVADYQGEGFALAHAIRGRDPRLRNTQLAVRLSTSAEICAVLNEDAGDAVAELVRGVERFPLRFADALLWPGGNSLEYYADFYGEDRLADAVRCPLPTSDDMAPPPDAPGPPADGPLRLLFLNRLERRKGIAELVAAVRAVPDADLRLTIVGRDTPTGPDGGSMAAHARALADSDERIEFADQVPHAEVPALIAAHHVVAIPARWETFSYVTREALAANRPVLATPSGGIVDVVVPERSGWLAPSSGVEDLEATLRELVAARDLVATMIAEERPRAVFEESVTNDEQVAVYERLIERGPAGRRGENRRGRDSAGRAESRGERDRTGARGEDKRKRDPNATRDGEPSERRRVDAIITLDGAGAGLDQTLRSLERQRGVELTSVLALGAHQRAPEPADLARVARVVERAATAGRPAAWADVLPSTESDVVVLVPAGTVLDPGFLAQAAAALADEPGIDYVTAFVDAGSMPWHAPFGNYALPTDEFDAGGSVAAFRRSALLDLLGSTEAAPADEAALYAALGAADAVGLVLHEPLVRRLPKRPHAD
jgi:glycogen synthase